MYLLLISSIKYIYINNTTDTYDITRSREGRKWKGTITERMLGRNDRADSSCDRAGVERWSPESMPEFPTPKLSVAVVSSRLPFNRSLNLYAGGPKVDASAYLGTRLYCCWLP